ncbi:hypothetical protein HK098_004950 [Nowakowskiella sp. JEL0407]|nr:hypothetical protein HK098_004950 [Nowakowskiella sp. JEL0407]
MILRSRRVFPDENSTTSAIPTKPGKQLKTVLSNEKLSLKSKSTKPLARLGAKNVNEGRIDSENVKKLGATTHYETTEVKPVKKASIKDMIKASKAQFTVYQDPKPTIDTDTTTTTEANKDDLRDSSVEENAIIKDLKSKKIEKSNEVKVDSPDDKPTNDPPSPTVIELPIDPLLFTPPSSTSQRISPPRRNEQVTARRVSRRKSRDPHDNKENFDPDFLLHEQEKKRLRTKMTSESGERRVELAIVSEKKPLSSNQKQVKTKEVKSKTSIKQRMPR